MYWSGVFDFHRHIINIFKKHAWSGYMWIMKWNQSLIPFHPSSKPPLFGVATAASSPTFSRNRHAMGGSNRTCGES
jgi:hypothetical protein